MLKKLITILTITIVILIVNTVAFSQSSKKQIQILSFENVTKEPNYNYLSDSIPNMIKTILLDLAVFDVDKTTRQANINEEELLDKTFKEGKDILITGSYNIISKDNKPEKMLLNFDVYDVKGKQKLYNFNKDFSLDEGLSEQFEEIDMFTKTMVEESAEVLLQDRLYKYDPMPLIRWFPKQGTVKYHLIFEKKEIYQGTELQYKFDKDLPNGKYEYYIEYENSDGSREKSKIYYLIRQSLEVTKYSIPNDCYFVKPEIRWIPNPGAEYYILKINGKEVYKGIDPKYKSTVNYPFGTYKIDLTTGNPFQKVDSSTFNLNIKKIQNFEIISPQNEEYFGTGPEESVNIKWTNAASKADYEISIDDNVIERVSQNSYTYSPFKNKQQKGDHIIKVKAIAGDQEISSQVKYVLSEFGLGEPLGTEKPFWDKMAESKENASYEECIRAILIVMGNANADKASYNELIKIAQEKEYIDETPDDSQAKINKGVLANMLMKSLDLPEGLMYYLTGLDRYAFRECCYLGIFANSDSAWDYVPRSEMTATISRALNYKYKEEKL